MLAKFTLLVAALFFSCLSLMGNASPANAHAGHSHRETADSAEQTVAIAPADEESLTENDTAAPLAQAARDGKGGVDAPEIGVSVSLAKHHQPIHNGNCCCGSIACHAGVATHVINVTDPYRLGEHLVLPPVVACIGASQDGIERPPRVPAAG